MNANERSNTWTIGLTDLDRTVIFPVRECTAGATMPASVLPDGRAVMGQDERHREFFCWMRGLDLVVPVTARDFDQFKRVRLDFGTQQAILCHGGIILDALGDVNRTYDDEVVRAPAQAAEEVLRDLMDWARRTFCRCPGHELRLIGHEDRQFYLQGKNREKDSFLSDLAAGLTERKPEGWRTFHRDADFALLPPYLGKEYAVQWWFDKVAPRPRMTVGFGDSDADMAFMRLCDYIVTSRRSQISDFLYERSSNARA